ncbi:spore coat U domain-containing protein [Sphingomonas cavernae]|uniref:SCPU domain-containing protein n=1 Tax=Sphingomonas cavernae TaxID=2320861 RepID=A0A418W6X1_9SPHN|nr:spore coat U domain-containing protein [Sphingomonas cavernae]RJF85793.1 SCPU domain-containing protein [Sphingomonas cavernae]
MRALIAFALLATPALAAAQPAPGNRSCSVRVHGLNFGVYDGLTAAPDLSLGRIELRCLPLGSSAGARVTLSTGNSGQYQDRVMTNGPHELRYNLYADPTRRRILGDGTGSTIPLPPRLTREFGPSVFRVFGIIHPRQLVPAGEYTDTIRIDVEF